MCKRPVHATSRHATLRHRSASSVSVSWPGRTGLRWSVVDGCPLPASAHRKRRRSLELESALTGSCSEVSSKVSTPRSKPTHTGFEPNRPPCVCARSMWMRLWFDGKRSLFASTEREGDTATAHRQGAAESSSGCVRNLPDARRRSLISHQQGAELVIRCSTEIHITVTPPHLLFGAMESSSDEEEVRTFVSVMGEKYNPENFPYGQGVVVLPSPQGSPIKGDRLFLPCILVLNDSGITKAGERSDIAAFCGHVVELDLSSNQLSEWAEICTIVENIPHLDFLNLSMNPLNGAELEPNMADVFSRVRRLVLINTHVSWDNIHTLTRNTPELAELFLCLNGFSAVSESPSSCPSLQLLQITDNRLQEWAEVRKLGLMYPGLSTLVLANNALACVGDTKETLPRLFPSLRSINLNNSGLSKWEDIERLNFFPKLQEVKVKGLPLLQPYSLQERRSLLIAQLPSVLLLNGSVVSAGEREDAERFFIRFHQDGPEREQPDRYHILVSKYGELAPLAEVDLSPRSTMVDVRWGDRVEAVSLRLEQTVGELKKQLRGLLQLPANGVRLFYINREMCSMVGPEELKCGCRALHSYSIRDGDEILVVPRVKSRCSSSDL